MRNYLAILGLLAIWITVCHSRTCSTTTCCDEHQFCRFWSLRGECIKNPSWMLLNCAMSCNSCVHTSSSNTNPILSQVELARRRQPSSSSLNAPPGCPAVVTRILEMRRLSTPDELHNLWQNRHCADMQTPTDCRINSCFHKKYRSWDGTCNNLQNNLLGASLTPYGRLLSADYDDQVQALSSRGRPSARAISTFLLSNQQMIPLKANSLMMVWSQFISHDVTKNALVPKCSCKTRGPNCANIPIPLTDGRSRQSTCIPMTRSVPNCASTIGAVREQMNENTAFLDASMVYHSNPHSAEALRIGAFMKTEIHAGGSFPKLTAHKGSFSVGDDRNSLFAGLAAMHTTFLRLHNSIASSLQNLNHHWNQDRIFQETRKIVGGAVQVITYQEYLPLLLGDFHKRLIPNYTRYQPSVNPSILNEFAAGAFRLHGMFQESYPLVDRHFHPLASVPADAIVNKVSPLLRRDAINDLYRGLMMTPCRSPQRVTPFLTETFISSDMASVNIQRGRDHGLRSYNDYRRLCGLEMLRSFDEWPEVSNQHVRNRVRELYSGNIDRIDLWVGGLLEEPVGDSAVGPTFACILSEQFIRLRDGDRFFYENPDIFTTSQREQLKKITLSWVLCQSSDGSIRRVAPNSFLVETGSSAVSCGQVSQPDFSVWRE